MLCQLNYSVLYAMETMAFASQTERGCDCGAYIRVGESIARNCGLKKKKTLNEDLVVNMLTSDVPYKRVSFLAFVFTFFGGFWYNHAHL